MRIGNSHYSLLMLLLLLFASPILTAQNSVDESNPDKLEGLQYWLDIDREVHTTESGLQYKVIIEGRGRKPEAKNTVSVHYRGLLLNGHEFDTSFTADEPVRLNLKRVIKGWTEGLQLMPPDSVYVFLIPPELAYGERGAGNIPPNSTLIFEIELFKSK